MAETENTVEPGNVPETEDATSVVVEDSERSLETDPIFLDSKVMDSAKAWSEALQSPPDKAAFSPSLETHSSYHGIGVRMATERSKSVAKFGIRTASYLSDMADAYGAIGETLTKGVKNIQPQLVKLPKTIESQADACVESVQEFGKNAKSRAKHYKKTIVSPLHNYLAAKEAAVDTNSIRYDAARTQSQEARKRALAARSKYKKAIREAEKALNRWKKARFETEPVASNGDSAGPTSPAVPPQESEHVWESVLREYGSSVPEETELLIQRLKETLVTKTRYEELVLSENVAVTHAQKIEATALDEILQVETSHVKYFFESVIKPIYKIEKGNIQLYSSRSEILESNLPLGEPGLDLRKGKELLSNIFTRPTQAYEEGQAVMSAETLGLPAESGQLRDKVKTKIAQVESEIKVIQLLSELLGSLHSGVTELEIGLKLNSNEMQAQGIGDAAAESIGPLAGQLWKDISSIYESEANAASSVSSKLDQAKSLVSDIVMESVQREVRKESEKDDYNWKMLCESARLETKAASRYRQTKATHDRARERVQSVDTTKSDDGSEDLGSGQQKNTGRMSKALFAGGEAMKKLQENARIAMAKSSLSEAEQNEAKEQQALDISTAAKSQAVEDYKRVTQARIDKLNGFLQERKNDVCTLTLTILSALEELDQQRLKVVQTLEASATTYESLLKDVEAWVSTSTETIKDSINKVPQVRAGNDEEEPGFQLEVQSVESEPLQWVFSQLKVETPAPAFLTDIDDGMIAISRSESEDAAEIVEDTPMNTTIPSRSPSAPLASTNDETDQHEPKFSPHTALNSLSIPVLKHSTSSAQKQTKAEKKSSTDKSSPNMKAFISQFFPDNAEVPTVHQVITCAYKPREKGGFLVPNLHGRVYTTDNSLYFLAWDGKNFVLPWSDVVSVSKEKGFMDNALCVTYSNLQAGESSFILSRLSARDSVLRHLQDRHRSTHRDVVEPVTQSVTATDDRPPVPPDELVQQMSIVVANPIRNVSIKEIYEKVWSEGVNTNEKPFYRPWLEAEECFDIEVGDWEFAEPGSEGFVNPWCQKKYTQKRVVLFKFKRTTHLYIGPPIAGVRQVQYCAVEGDDKCVVQISVTFDGIPYSDTFAVEMRWVARRVEGGDVFVEVGLDVDFKKSTMLKSQIRSGTIAETRNVHLRMFEAAKVACSSPETLQLEEPEDEAEPEIIAKQPVKVGLPSRILGIFRSVPVDPGFLFMAGALVSYPILWNVFASLLGAPAISVNEARALNNRIDQLQEEIHGLRVSLDVAIELLKKKP